MILLASVIVRGFAVCGYDPRQDDRRRFPAVIADLFSAYERAAMAS